MLETMPEIGRRREGWQNHRELIINFGKSGYIALYRYEPAANAVFVLAFRHQKEAGY